MKGDPEVERWFAEKKRPADAALRRVREIILAADPRMTEFVQYGTVQFASDATMAVFVQHGKKTVTLMFNRGQLLEGEFPHLEGDGPNARFMRFADLAEVEAHADELTRAVVAWCNRLRSEARLGRVALSPTLYKQCGGRQPVARRTRCAGCSWPRHSRD